MIATLVIVVEMIILMVTVVVMMIAMVTAMVIVVVMIAMVTAVVMTTMMAMADKDQMIEGTWWELGEWGGRVWSGRM